MKREGRLHGNGIAKTTTTTTKIFTTTPKFSSKPIFNSPPNPNSPKQKHPHTHNRSKLIGKCGKARCGGIGCHVCRSKDKAHKGTYKLRSCDVGLNHSLISWRVVDNKGLHQLNYVGVSATQVLDQLKNHYYDDEEDFDDDDDDAGKGEDDQFGMYGEEEEEEEDHKDGAVSAALVVRSVHVEDGIDENGIDDGADEDEGEDGVSDDDDDEMGDFCDVGYFVIEQLDGDEDWCLVGEL